MSLYDALANEEGDTAGGFSTRRLIGSAAEFLEKLVEFAIGDARAFGLDFQVDGVRVAFQDESDGRLGGRELDRVGDEIVDNAGYEFSIEIGFAVVGSRFLQQLDSLIGCVGRMQIDRLIYDRLEGLPF